MVTNILPIVENVQGILSELESHDARVKWNVDVSSMRGSTRHLCPQQVLFYTMLSGVELLLSDWEDVEVSVGFKEVDDVDYETLVRYLEEFPDDVDSEGGAWVQGLFRVALRVSNHKPSSNKSASPRAAEAGHGVTVQARCESLEQVGVTSCSNLLFFLVL
jgi:hypothetical protein